MRVKDNRSKNIDFAPRAVMVLLSQKPRKELEHVKKALDLVYDSLNEEIAKYEELKEKEKNGKTQEEKEKIEGWYDYDFELLEDNMPIIYNNSFFVTIMSIVEINLYDACHEIVKNNKASSEIRFYRGSKINKCIEFLDHEGLLNRERARELEMFIDICNKIRNCIIHNDGYLNDRYSHEVKNYCSNIPTISIDENNYINLTLDYLKLTIHQANRFFEHNIFHDIQKYM